MAVAAPAKVNLWLKVGPPRPSGFHDLSTLFCALDLADTITLHEDAPSGRADDTRRPLEISFAPPLTALPELGDPGSNLAVLAARRFLERCGEPPEKAPHIRLVKRIPAGGGLGGGSSDAGAVLRAMCRMHPRRLDTDQLQELAAELGSDVPFFVLGTPLAHGTGRGERLDALQPLPPRPVVLVLPPFPVATADAFRWLDADRSGQDPQPEPPAEAHPRTGSAMTWAGIVDWATNDFEPPVFTRHPELREIRDALHSHGARPALLAGSGSTLFGVFEDRPAATAAARAIGAAFPDCRVFVTATRTR